MIFMVPEDFKGSFVLSTLNKALWAGCHISITGNDIFAPDVKNAIKNGALVPFEKEEYENISDISHDAMIVNKTAKKLVLGEIILQPWASRLVDKDIADSREVRGAESNGFVAIISDKESLADQKVKKVRKRPTVVIKSKKKKTAQKTVKKTKKKTEETKPVKIVEPTQREEEENKTVAQVWDFQEKKAKEAELVNKVSNIVQVEDEETPVKKTKKKTTKKKITAKKKKATAKKKGKTTKKKKVKAIEPVGQVRKPDENVAVELDSRGNPLQKPSNALEAMIDKAIEEISFVDKEQEVQKKAERGIIEDWDWDEL